MPIQDLRELVEKWRAKADKDVKLGGEDVWIAEGIFQCADDLEHLINTLDITRNDKP